MTCTKISWYFWLKFTPFLLVFICLLAGKTGVFTNQLDSINENKF